MKLLTTILILIGILIAGCTQQEPKCGIEECHGLDITCGSDVPEACTEIYMLGDFCRKYFAGCEIVDGNCLPVERKLVNTQFDKCKSCVEECDKISNPEEAFECEYDCRIQMQLYCEQDEDCACGIHKETNDCFYGNRAYVDTSQQCPDFCTGIAGNLIIKCVNNECTQVSS